jgi:hypothetical protein
MKNKKKKSKKEKVLVDVNDFANQLIAALETITQLTKIQFDAKQKRNR